LIVQTSNSEYPGDIVADKCLKGKEELSYNTDMKLRVVLLAVLLVILVVGGWWLTKKLTKIHYHAGFQVYVDGEKQDFSGDQFMNNEPCSIAKETAEDIQRDKGHLHDNVGDVVHIHTSGAVWGDLFKNLNFVFPATESAEFYLDGIKTDKAMSTPIKAYDSLVVLVGAHGDINQILNNQVSREYIQSVEKKSDGCGS
jgi:hypothetical protein